MKKIAYIDEKYDGLSPEYNQFCAIESKINELVEAVNTLIDKPKSWEETLLEPSKPSEEEVNWEQAYNREHVIVKHLTEKMESIRADEREKIAKQIEEFAHIEMKGGNWAYEKLLILLRSLK